jgi:hypothetical protein
MNQYLESTWDERIERLALGLEPIDAGTGTRLSHPLRVLIDQEARGLTRPRVERHPSCLHALTYQQGVAGSVLLRFVEPEGRPGTRPSTVPRRIVPRLIAFPIVPVADTADGAPRQNPRHRVRRPWLYPGAAYDVAAGMTGLRGRVLRDGLPERWTRVVARVGAAGPVVGRAHGDDRGEFLLLLSSAAGEAADETGRLTLHVEVFARDPGLPGPPRSVPGDELWDLPREEAIPLDPLDFDLDAVATAEALPVGFVPFDARDVDLELGQIAMPAALFQKP